MNLAVRPKVMVSITRSSAVRWQQVRTRRSDTASRDGDRPCSGFPRLHRPGDATQRGCQAPFSQHIGHQNALPPPRCCQCMRLITRKVLLDLTVSAAEEKTNATHVFQPACTLRQRGLRPQGISPHTARPLLAAPHRTAPRLAPSPSPRSRRSATGPPPRSPPRTQPGQKRGFPRARPPPPAPQPRAKALMQIPALCSRCAHRAPAPGGVQQLGGLPAPTAACRQCSRSGTALPGSGSGCCGGRGGRCSRPTICCTKSLIKPNRAKHNAMQETLPVTELQLQRVSGGTGHALIWECCGHRG